MADIFDNILSSLESLHERLQVIARNQDALAQGQVTQARVLGVLADMVATLGQGDHLDADAIAALRQMADPANGEPAGTAH